MTGVRGPDLGYAMNETLKRELLAIALDNLKTQAEAEKLREDADLKGHAITAIQKNQFRMAVESGAQRAKLTLHSMQGFLRVEKDPYLGMSGYFIDVTVPGRHDAVSGRLRMSLGEGRIDLNQVINSVQNGADQRLAFDDITVEYVEGQILHLARTLMTS